MEWVKSKRERRGSSYVGLYSLALVLMACGDESDPDAATEATGTGGSADATAGTNTDGPTGGTGSGADTNMGSGSADDTTSGDPNDPPWIPGITRTEQPDLPGGGPIACEWDWTIRLLAPYQNFQEGHAPRRMYFASCDTNTPTPTLLTSYTVGDKPPEMANYPTTGGLTVSTLDPATGALEVQASYHFPECRSMHGVAASSDCSTVAVLCRLPNDTPGADHDPVADYPGADWITNENVCGENPGKMNEHMWLYEWPEGDLSQPPVKVIVHKSIGSWEYGQNNLRYAEPDDTYGIALKTTVGEATDCHEADSFMVLDRNGYAFTDRGWDWACAAGHTVHNRPAYDPVSQQYAMLCSTDWNEGGQNDHAAISFRTESDNQHTEIHYASRYNALWIKGGAGPLVPRSGGGFVGIIVGEPAPIVGGYDDTIPTQLGLVRFTADGVQDGEIVWVAQDDDSFYAWPQIAPLGPDRYLLGWGAGLRVSDMLDGSERNKSLRIPWTYWMMEIDGDGNPLTQPEEVADVGWGEVNEMVPLGPGRVAWSYVPDAVLDSETAEVPDCNQDALVHYVYTSPTPPN